jgi:hypothetical protein
LEAASSTQPLFRPQPIHSQPIAMETEILD